MGLMIDKAAKCVKILRLKEVLPMLGFLHIGCIFAISEISLQICLELLTYLMSSVFYVISSYAFNAYGGYEKDIYNQRLLGLQQVKPTNFLLISIFFGFLFCFGYALLSFEVLLLSLFPFVLGIWYAWPEKGAKYYPIIGTVIHFVAQVFLFHMGYLVIKEVDNYSISVSIYFAILLSAAHLNHEVIDYEADKISGSRSSAVSFGVDKVEKVSLLLYSLAAIYWIYLYVNNIVETVPFYAFLLAFIAQFLTKIYLIPQKHKLPQNEHSKVHIRYRNLYRRYYLLGGIVITFYQVINSLK